MTSNCVQIMACLLMVVTVSLKFSISSLADSGLSLVRGRSVLSDTDLYSHLYYYWCSVVLTCEVYSLVPLLYPGLAPHYIDDVLAHFAEPSVDHS